MSIGYAVEIDHSYDAIVLRDLCRKAAEKHDKQARRAQTPHARKDNADRAEIFGRYADRFEHIREQEAARITASLGL